MNSGWDNVEIFFLVVTQARTYGQTGGIKIAEAAENRAVEFHKIFGFSKAGNDLPTFQTKRHTMAVAG